MKQKNYVAVIDCGSQTTQLIARKLRELGVLAKVFLPNVLLKNEESPAAIIISGGPESLTQVGALRIDPAIFSSGLPILGICYGMQLMAEHFGGEVIKAKKSEFGLKKIEVIKESELFFNIPPSINVWMSHTDQVSFFSKDLVTIAKSDSCPHAAISFPSQKIYGLQFHPEVSHSDFGSHILSNFVFRIARLEKNFSLSDLLSHKIQQIKEKVGDSKVIMALSGGLDSMVAAKLIHQAINERLHCVYVNHGLHRLGEVQEVSHLFSELFDLSLNIVDAREQFFSALTGIRDPEEKRKIIGRVFIEVFEKEATSYKNVAFLAQGTVYSDVIESKAQGARHTIKSHHNVGGLPKQINFKLLEPLNDLFKDEVRELGKSLGLPPSLLNRQPFPGPGLSVRIPGELSLERVSILQKADHIVREEIERAQKNALIKNDLWQWFAILLPIKSVGVMGDARSYGDTIVIRCVESVNAMTADWAKIPYEVLGLMSSRITNEVNGISRVLYDISQKPPGTIEWE